MAFKVAPADKVKQAMEAIGVGDDTLLVGYDDEGGHFVSRVWLVLRAYGHGNRVRILEGGLTRWLAEGRPLSTAAASPCAATFTPGPPDTSHLVTAAEVEARAERPEHRYLDVRRRTEYTGAEARARRGGRIPGATHVLWQDNLTGPATATCCRPSDPGPLRGGRRAARSARHHLLPGCRPRGPQRHRPGDRGLPQCPDLRRLLGRVGQPRRPPDRVGRVARVAPSSAGHLSTAGPSGAHLQPAPYPIRSTNGGANGGIDQPTPG